MSTSMERYLDSLLVSTIVVDPGFSESSGAMLFIWLPAAVLGNALALYWLYRTAKLLESSFTRNSSQSSSMQDSQLLGLDS